MKRYSYAAAVIVSFCLLVSLSLSAQDLKPGLLGAQDLKRVVPATYFFRGQTATVQLRNSGGFSSGQGQLVLAALVDTSGYSSDVSARYQGLLITEVKLNVEGTDLAPGAYGFGFSKDGKFTVMDVGANDLFSVSTHVDDKLARPVPLKVAADGDGYRLFVGKKWVSLKAE